MHAKREIRSVRIVDDEGRPLGAVWSRSGKRLIVSVWPRVGSHSWVVQKEMTSAEVAELGEFLSESLNEATSARGDESILLIDEQEQGIQAAWTHSGKSLAITMEPRGDWVIGVALNPDQVADLAEFLASSAEEVGH